MITPELGSSENCAQALAAAGALDRTYGRSAPPSCSRQRKLPRSGALQQAGILALACDGFRRMRPWQTRRLFSAAVTGDFRF